MKGTARLGLGGEGGIEVEVAEGDVVLVPAGVGHRRVAASAHFQMAGGYPPGQQGDIVRPGEINEAQAARAIAALPLPQTDPLTGERGGLLAFWKT